MIRPLFSLSIALLLQPLLPGQAVGLGRGSCLGKIESEKKQDWKGAEVFFFSRPYTGCFEAGEPDIVNVRAGDNGRFQAKLLRGRVYDVWAIKRIKEGRYYSTNIAKSIVAGKLVELKAGTKEQMEVRLRLAGQMRWPDRGPFRLQALCRNKQGLVFDLAFDEKGEARLPPVPGQSVTVLVSAADGQRLLSKTVNVSASSRKGGPERLEKYREKYAKDKAKRVEEARKKALEEAKKAKPGADPKPGTDPKAEAGGKVGATGKAAKKEKAAKVAGESDEEAEAEVVEEVSTEDGEVDVAQVAQKKEAGQKAKKPVPLPEDPFPEYLEGPIPGEDVELLVLPRVFKARFLVQDASDGPLANVEVRHEYADGRLGRFPVLGKTDEKGRIDLIVPQPFSGYGIPRGKPTFNFLFSGPESARTQDGWSSYQRGNKKPMTNEEVVAGVSEIRKVGLSNGFSIKGHVYWRKGEPAKNFPVVVGMPALVSYGPNSYGTSSRRSFLIYTDDHGGFVVPGWHQNLYGGTLGLWVDGKELVKRFGLDMDVPDSLIQPFPVLNLWGQSGEMDLGSIYLSAMRVAQVEVRTGKGEQASFAEVAASLSQSMNWGSIDQDPAFFRVADRRGRALILVPDSQRNLFVRLEGHGYFFGGMQIPEGEIDIPLKVLPQLRPFSKVTGRIVDEKGKPIAGADLSIRSSTMMGGGPDVNMIYNINWRLLRGKSDQEGYFALEFIPHPNIQFGVGVRASVEGKSYSAPDMIQIGNQPRSGLVIELPVNLTVARKEAKEQAEKRTKATVQEAGNAVKSAVGDASAGIGNAFQGFLDRAKALAARKKAVKQKPAKKEPAKKGAAKATDATSPSTDKKEGKKKTVGNPEGKTGDATEATMEKPIGVNKK